jgi:hypothetical protein
MSISKRTHRAMANQQQRNKEQNDLPKPHVKPCSNLSPPFPDQRSVLTLEKLNTVPLNIECQLVAIYDDNYHI